MKRKFALSGLSCILIGSVVALAGCGGKFSKVDVVPQQMVPKGESVVLSATCERVASNCTSMPIKLYVGNKASGTTITPQSCSDNGGTSIYTVTFEFPVQESNMTLTCGETLYGVTGLTSNQTLSVEPMTIAFGQTFSVTATANKKVESATTVEFSASESSALAAINSKRCSIESGNNFCSVLVTANTGAIAESDIVTAIAAGYVNGAATIIVLPTPVPSPTPSPTPSCAKPNMFLTAAWVTPGGGLTAANNACNADTNVVSGCTYKAFLATSSSTVGNIDAWTNSGMKGSTIYYRTDLTTPILTTLASGAPPAQWTNNVDLSDGEPFWSGQGSASQCSNWTVGTASSSGLVGVDNSSTVQNDWNASGSNTSSEPCNSSMALLCVSQ